MKNLRRLSAAVILTFALGLSAFAGEIPTGPCAAPGELQTPPCAAAQMSSDDSAAPGQTDTPPASGAGDIVAVVDAAMNLLLLF